MNNKPQYVLVQTEITNADGETGMVYGIKVEAYDMSSAVYDISCYKTEAESCLHLASAQQIEPAQLFEFVGQFVSQCTGVLV